MKSKLIILITFIIYNSSIIICTAQQTNLPDRQTGLDSLYSVWQDQSQADSTRVTAYSDYIWKGYLFSRPDTADVMAEALHVYANEHSYPKASATGYNLQGIANAVQGNYPLVLEYFQKSLAIFEEIGDKKGIAGSLGNIGNIYDNQGNYPRALEYHRKSLAIKEEIGDKKGISASLGNIGGIYIGQGNYLRALEYFQKSLAIKEELGDKRGIAVSLGNIGNIYRSQGNYPRALEYYQKSLAIYEELGDKRGIATSLNNIGNIYYYQGNYPRALEYYKKSLAIEEEIGDKRGIASSLVSIGLIYAEQGNYPHALEYYQNSLAIKEEIGDKRGISYDLNNIGTVYQEQGKNSLALYYFQKSLALSEDIGALNNQKNACQSLYDAYKSLDKSNEALVYLEKLNVINDSLKAEETTKKLEQMEFAKVMLQDSIANAEEARLVQEAHEDEMRQEEKTRNYIAGAGLLFLLLAGGYYSRWRYVRNSKAVLQVEKDRSENLLLNILPEEIAEELKEKGRAEARDFDMVTIIFTDFKGFTSLSEKLSAQELVAEINSCFEAFDGIMGELGIEKIKTIGDAYMAAGGLPVPSEDSVKNCVLAGLQMQEFIAKRKIELEAQGKPAFQMRVGIHTGPVVAGIVGVKKFQYDIWGDTVNTASRMESSGAVGQVNISQSTYELMKDDPDFAFESRGKVEAKGKGEMEMWFVKLLA